MFKKNRYFLLFLTIFFISACSALNDVREPKIKIQKPEPPAVEEKVEDPKDIKIKDLELQIRELQSKLRACEDKNFLDKNQLNAILDSANQECERKIAELKNLQIADKKEIARLNALNSNLIKEPPAVLELEADKKNVPFKPKKEDKMLAYNNAYASFQKANYDEAIRGFHSFLESNPPKDYIDNAYFWLGECYFQKQNYNSASSYFNKVIDEFPKENKRFDSMYKLGHSYFKLNKKPEAKKYFQMFIDQVSKNKELSIEYEDNLKIANQIIQKL